MKSFVLFLLMVGSSLTPALAQKPPIPAANTGSDAPTIIADGFSAYQKTGNKAALSAWLKGSPVESDSATRSKVEGLFNAVESLYGKLTGFRTVRVVGLGASLRIVYVVAEYEKGPLFASFNCYKTSEGWIIPSLDFNTKSREVFPPALIDGSQD